MGEAKRRSDTYSPAEVADFCRVTRRTVYQWLSTGALSAYKAGPKVWVITRAQLDLFLAGRSGPQEEKQPLAPKPDPMQHTLPPEMLPQGSGKWAATAKKKAGRRR